MQSAQPTGQDSRHYHTDESPRSIKGCCLFTKLCTYTPPRRPSSLSRSLFLPLSCIFLNGCLHCSLSFLSYLHPAAFHWAEVPSRHKIVADIPRALLIIVEWRPQPCRLLSPCLGLCWGIGFLPGHSQSPEIPSLSAGKDTIR